MSCRPSLLPTLPHSPNAQSHTAPTRRIRYCFDAPLASTTAHHTSRPTYPSLSSLTPSAPQPPSYPKVLTGAGARAGAGPGAARCGAARLTCTALAGAFSRSRTTSTCFLRIAKSNAVSPCCRGGEAGYGGNEDVAVCVQEAAAPRGKGRGAMCSPPRPKPRIIYSLVSCTPLVWALSFTRSLRPVSAPALRSDSAQGVLPKKAAKCIAVLWSCRDAATATAHTRGERTVGVGGRCGYIADPGLTRRTRAAAHLVLYV